MTPHRKHNVMDNFWVVHKWMRNYTKRENKLKLSLF